MAAPPTRIDVDFAVLERHMRLLGHANRLELLALLRRPHTLDEIHLSPSSAQAGETPDRPISRQAVQQHLDKLVESGLVRVRSTDRKGKRSVNEYHVDHARLFAVAEELRQIASIESTVDLDLFRTEGIADARERVWDEGPKLVLVHGVREGTAFPLRRQDARPPRGWIIGRAAEAQVSIEYDPYVSHENAEILRRPDGYHLLDLRSARNGTWLNWRRLPVGGEVQLQSGDVIGVGRSLLVFRDG